MVNARPARFSILAIIGPGIVLAATGVGAGDLVTASLAGSKLGLAVLWAVWVGATLKWFLNEGIARWQMATATTLLEGWTQRLGRWIRWLFLAYLLIWTVFTGGALVNACGVAGAGLFPPSADPRTSKIVWGVAHSLAGAALVRIGGFKLFERMMSSFIAVMFVTVVTTALLSDPDWAAVGRGLCTPRIPPRGLGYVLGLLGGVGGTVTLMSYGYWIRERGRAGAAGLRACRIDLALGYLMTALFGLAMVVIGSRVRLEKGPALVLDLAAQLGEVLGPTGEWIFLVGFWGAVFSSLLGVWQSIPYLFADFVMLTRPLDEARASLHADFSRMPAYRGYLTAIAVLPLPMLWVSLERAQLVYAVFGSFFMPLLALTLLLMNTRAQWVGEKFRNGWSVNAALVLTLLFFGWVATRKAWDWAAALLAG